MSMPESTYLAGKVRKQSLPVLGAGGPDAPTLKRLRLPQGELAQFYDANEPVRYLAFLELRPDTVRGNHLHRVKEEFLYLVQGELQVIVEDPESGQRELVELVAGDLVTIQPGVAHAMRVRAGGQAVEFSPARFNPADNYKYQLT